MIMIFSARLRRDCLLSLGFKCPRLSLPWVNGKKRGHQNFRCSSVFHFLSLFRSFLRLNQNKHLGFFVKPQLWWPWLQAFSAAPKGAEPCATLHKNMLQGKELSLQCFDTLGRIENKPI